MTDEEFIAVALTLPAAERVINHGRPGIAVKGKLFAGPGDGRGGVAVLKFTPEQQEFYCEMEPAVFRRDPSGWGKLGWTSFILEAADAPTARSGLAAAWRNVASKTLLKAHPDL